MSYYDYTQPWDQHPEDVPRHFGQSDLGHKLPALLEIEGWHFCAWEPLPGRYGDDPYYLYAPDGTLVAEWTTAPSYGEMYDVYHAWVAGHGS